MGQNIELMTVLKELHNISGFKITIFDTEQNVIAAYPEELCAFCKYIQCNPQAKRMCVENDITAFKQVEQTNETYLYQCKFGLYEAVAPLYSFDTLIGYMMMGQSIEDAQKSRQYVYDTALPFVQDRGRLADAILKIPARAKDKLLSCISIMDICAKYITLSNRLYLSKSDIASEIKKYIQQNFQNHISIDLLCKHFFLSRATIMNSFKKKYGIRICDYISSVRIKRAEELLHFTDKSIKEIALDCGFSDQNYFSKVFFKEKGITPTGFKKQYQTISE